MDSEAFEPSDLQPSFRPAVTYRDPKHMYRWLEEAFGFEPHGVIFDGEGNLMHSQMSFGNGIIMVGTEWSDRHRSPTSIGGYCTQTVHVQLNENVDAHCERARAAGAEIQQEPATQFFGDRTYRAIDPEGHIWTFAQTVKIVTPAQWDADLGIKTTKSLPN
jgi:uncharacterized glyoxalase superfamily protein PhnB